MTKNQWLVYWREKRLEERRRYAQSTGLFINTFNEFLKEVCAHIYTDKQEVTISLVHRYKEKLSPEYLSKHEKLVQIWKPEAKERAAELFRNLVYSKNPLLSMISKGSDFPGQPFPIPIK